jgi:hypothetical protein
MSGRVKFSRQRIASSGQNHVFVLLFASLNLLSAALMFFGRGGQLVPIGRTLFFATAAGGLLWVMCFSAPRDRR